MSRNENMHPRNIYRTPPDYVDLAIQYPEFRKISRLELNGKVSIDLKTREALEQLTKALLLKDFQLDVLFSKNCLIPTVPLRLNYILWLEDIINTFELSNIEGIDIGCGAAAIYSILGAKKNNWKMSGLELHKENIDYAILNVKNNHLEDKVSIFAQTKEEVLIKDFMESFESRDKMWTFCMCNPPFYDSSEKLPDKRTYRKRKMPKNAATGAENELVYEDGGEIGFIEKLIAESICFKDRMLFFTTMVGHKSSVQKILGSFRSKNIVNVLQTQFCQGNTTRWGLAWSFHDHLDLKRCQSLCIGNDIMPEKREELD